MFDDASFLLVLFLVILIVVVIVGESRRRRGTRYRELTGNAYRAMKDGSADHAVDCLNRFLAEFPRDPWGLAMRGGFRLQIDDFDGALSDCTLAIREGWNKGDNHFHVGCALLRKGNLEEAIAQCTQGLKLQPRNAEGFQLRGYAHYHAGRHQEAIADLSALLDLSSVDSTGSPACESDREYTYPATVDLNAVIQRQRIEGYSIRAAAHYQTANYASALDDARRVLEVNSDDVWMHNLTAWIKATCPAAEYRDGKEAVANATRACELTRFADAYCLGTLAAAHAESGDFDEAVRREVESRQLGPAERLPDSDLRLALYRECQPFRETPPTPTRSPHP